MRYRTIVLIGVVTLLLTVCASRAMACSCAGPNAPCQDYGRAAAVFIGTAIDLRTIEPSPNAGRNSEEHWAPRIFKFSVEQSFLGTVGTEIEVSTGRGGGDCGYDFKMGERYVVYAYVLPQRNRLATSICNRTRPYDKAEEDLEFLRKLGSMGGGVTIYGEVKRSNQRVAQGDATNVRAMPEVSLIIEGTGVRKEIQTDAEGRYSVAGLPAGKYKVRIVLPDELFIDRAEQEVTVTDRGCAAVTYYVVDNGRLSGTVFDPEGQPVPGVLLALMNREHTDIKKDYIRLERTDDQGRYRFSAVPQGNYILSLNMNRFPDPNDKTNAFPRTYYPGVTEISKAETIAIGVGENLTQRDLHLPTRRAESVIKGQVVWSEGTPVANAMVAFRDVSYHDPQMNHAIQADERGYFTVRGYVGQVFVFEARSNRPYVGDRRSFQPMEKVEPVRVTLTHPTHDVKILINKLR